MQYCFSPIFKLQKQNISPNTVLIMSNIPSDYMFVTVHWLDTPGFFFTVSSFNKQDSILDHKQFLKILSCKKNLLHQRWGCC